MTIRGLQTNSEWHYPLVLSRSMNLNKTLQSTTLKVGIVVFGAGAIGALAVTVGAFEIVSGGNLIFGIGCAAGGVTLWSIDLTGLAITSLVKRHRNKKAYRHWLKNNYYFKKLDKNFNLNELRCKYYDPEEETGFSRHILRYDIPQKKSCFFSNTSDQPQFFVKVGGKLGPIQDGSIAAHNYEHPLNDAIAYWLDQLLGFGVVPKTLVFENSAKAQKALGLNQWPENLDFLGEKNWTVVVQEAVPHPKASPIMNTGAIYTWMDATPLNKDQAHKAILFNIIAGRRDNYFNRVENSVVSVPKKKKKSEGSVFSVDNEQLGFSINDQVFTVELENQGHSGHLYHWLFDHKIAQEEFSEELIEQVQQINPNDVKELFSAIELQYKISLDSQFKQNIVNNLKAVQAAFNSETPPLTPLELFKMLHPRAKDDTGTFWPNVDWATST